MDTSTHKQSEEPYWIECANCNISLLIHANNFDKAKMKAIKCHWTTYITDDGDWLWKCPDCSDKIKNVITEKIKTHQTINVTEKNKIFDRLSSLLSYKPGWSNGEGIAFTKETVDLAKDLCNLAINHGMINLSISAGLSGEILISSYLENNITIELFAESDNTITYAFAKDDKYIEYDDKTSIDIIKQKLNIINLMYNNV